MAGKKKIRNFALNKVKDYDNYRARQTDDA